MLIGLMGKKGCGKDTFAQRLIENYGYTRVAFADPLKKAVNDLDPIVTFKRRGLKIRPVRISELVRDEWGQPQKIKEVRRLLQRFGTEVARDNFGKNFWIDLADKAVNEVDGPVVITDVRFKNEADYVKSRGGILVRIVRRHDDDNNLVTDETAQHASEIESDAIEADHVIVNWGNGVENFWAGVDLLMDILVD